MSMSKENKEIRDMMEKESPKNIVVSFLLAMVFGVAAALAAMAFRETFEDLALKLIINMQSSLEATQTTGFRRISQISAIIIMLGGWMTSFMVVWSKLEKRKDMKSRIIFGAKSIAIALALFAIFCLIHYFGMDGTWPTLSGSV